MALGARPRMRLPQIKRTRRPYAQGEAS
jgi:hypothetical protein